MLGGSVLYAWPAVTLLDICVWLLMETEHWLVLAFDLNQNSYPCVLVTCITKSFKPSEAMKGQSLLDQE